MLPDPLAAHAFGTGVIHLVAHVSLLSKLLKLPSCGFFPLIFLWGSAVTVFFSQVPILHKNKFYSCVPLF